MAKQDWGSKRVCQSCATKFYDFGRTPIVCPKCGTGFDPEILLKSRRIRPSAVSKPVKAVVKPPALAKDKDDDDIDLDDNDIAVSDDDDADADDAVLVDASDLEDDDVTKVVGAADGDQDEDR